jgi:hypothetical protein
MEFTMSYAFSSSIDILENPGEPRALLPTKDVSTSNDVKMDSYDLDTLIDIEDHCEGTLFFMLKFEPVILIIVVCWY